jgi:Holliday junction resolvasome RuvABC endonuclease subunit
MYLGIDQSLRCSGVAVIGKSQELLYVGTITPGKLTGAPRLGYIRSALRDVLAANPEIEYAAIEGYSYGSGAGRTFELGEVGAVMKLALFDAGIPYLTVSPAGLKQFVAGNGHSDKERMREFTLRKWGIDFEDRDDECDAYGLAHVARSVHLGVGKTRAELEVVKKLKNTDKKISLVATPAKIVSI